MQKNMLAPDAESPPTALAGNDGQVAGPSGASIDAESAASEREVSEHEGTEVAWLFRPDRDPAEFPLTELGAIIEVDANLAWVDLCGYSEQQLHELAPVLDLQKAEVYAALSPWQRPRMDIHGDHFFVSLTVARLDPQARRVQAGELDLYVGNNFLLSLHKLPLPFAERILGRARQSPELVQLDSAFMLYIILDELLAYYEDLYEHVDSEIEHLEERALTNTSDDFLANLVEFKRYVAAIGRLAEQHRQVFSAFLRPDFRFVHGGDVEVYYRDLEVRLARLTDTLDAAKDAVTGAFDIYVSHVSHRTNQIIKVLTIVSTVLLPVTVILAFFATGFHGIGIYQSSGFVAMLACIAVVVSGILITFWRRGWL